jgi:cyclase
MLRKRLVTILTFHDGVLTRTKRFEPDYRYTHNFVDAWQVDEIVALDVTRPGQGARETFLSVVREIADRCFVPLAAGGGVRTLADVEILLRAGADKIVVNTGALDRPALIEEIARAYGSQCAVIAIDARQAGEGYEVFAAFGARATGLAPEAWAKRAEARGAGEILITSIERDGSLMGYDTALCRAVADAVTIPVLVAGGAGNWQHFVDGILQGGAEAVCTSNVYHFTEASILSAKAHMAAAGIPVRT